MAIRRILSLLAGLIFLSGPSAARSRGKEFITAFLCNFKQHQTNAKFELLITGYHPATTVVVTANNSTFRKTIPVNEGVTVSIELPNSVEMLGTNVFDKTVLIRADKDISVSSHSHKDYTAGATVVYPVQQLGTLYYALTPEGDMPDTFKEFAVVASEAPTRVEIHLKGNVRFKGQNYPAGSRLVADLDAFQAIQLQSSADLSGTRVESTKPVAVLSGHSCAKKNTACDHVVEQLLPVSSWGTTFLVPPLSFQSQSDIAYVITAQDTSIRYQNGPTEESQSMVAGQVIQLDMQNPQPLYISADAGIQVLFFFTGATNGGSSYDQLIPLFAGAPEGSRIYDPFLINVPALTSYCRLYHIDGMRQNDNYLVIIANATETRLIKVAKRPLDSILWQPINGTEYSWAEYSLSTGSIALSVEHPSSPFGLFILGGSYRDGYGSAALCSCRSAPSSSALNPGGSAPTSPVLNSNEESLLYPYGTSNGDDKNPKSDDGISPQIFASVPFTFYGKEHHSFYVNNNGMISFGQELSEYTPSPLPLDGGVPFVIPYWADVHNRISGDVFWRQTQDPNVLDRCTKNINQYFPEIPFTAAWALIATWDRVAYFGSKAKSSKVNTFQAVLTTNRKASFVILNYADIQWTTGAANGGDPKTGLGGTPAQAGFDSGDQTNYYVIPASHTPDILNIGKTSNVNIPGRWVFQVNEFVTGITTDCFI
ncbi:IgGFc-binding protein-like [Hemicordylus capensis]|uniref:IgGFc-binding protein-like n=1 Tax=Hemicordylus capensis TaxID=884348 RepID=UPI002303B08E|nr:IgGFc-binding protein-like [Hemicordylus capensis]